MVESVIKRQALQKLSERQARGKTQFGSTVRFHFGSTVGFWYSLTFLYHYALAELVSGLKCSTKGFPNYQGLI